MSSCSLIGARKETSLLGLPALGDRLGLISPVQQALVRGGQFVGLSDK